MQPQLGHAFLENVICALKIDPLALNPAGQVVCCIIPLNQPGSNLYLFVQMCWKMQFLPWIISTSTAPRVLILILILKSLPSQQVFYSANWLFFWWPSIIGKIQSKSILYVVFQDAFGIVCLPVQSDIQWSKGFKLEQHKAKLIFYSIIFFIHLMFFSVMGLTNAWFES